MIYIVSYPESTFDECWMFCAISDFTKLELAFPNECFTKGTRDKHINKKTDAVLYKECDSHTKNDWI